MTFLEMHVQTRHPNSPQTSGTGPKTVKAGSWPTFDRRAPVSGPRVAFQRFDDFTHRKDSPARIFLLRETNRLVEGTSRSLEDRLNALYCLHAGLVDEISLRSYAGTGGRNSVRRLVP